MNVKDRFFFLHLPKTAGISLHQLLKRTAGPYLHLQHPHELRWPAAMIWPRFRGCGGHLNWARADRAGFSAAFTLTFVRDPIERVLSQYGFARHPDLGDQGDAIQARRSTLKNLLRAAIGGMGSFANAQTLGLSGLASAEARPEEHLASALETLERIDFVGVTEAFVEDSAALTRLLGWAESLAVPFENRTQSPIDRGALDAETLDLLEQTQSLDRIVHRRALELRARRTAIPLVRSEPSPAGWPPLADIGDRGEVKFGSVKVGAVTGEPLRPGMIAEIQVHCIASKPVADVALGFFIEDVLGNYIAGTNTFLLTQSGLFLAAGESWLRFRFPVTFGAGRYVLSVSVHEQRAAIFRSQTLCWSCAAEVLEVLPPLSPYREGMVDLSSVEFARAGESGSGGGPLSEAAARQVKLSMDGGCRIDPATGDMAILIRLRNDSDRILSSVAPTSLFISYHWTRDEGDGVFDGRRTSLPHPVCAGESVPVSVRVDLPPRVGRWRWEGRVVQEGVRWHEGPGFEDVVLPGLPVELLPDGRIVIPCAIHRIDCK